MWLWRHFTGLPRILRVFLVVFAALFAGLSLDWRPAREVQVPQVVDQLHASGELQAGAARVALVPPFPVPLASMNTREDETSAGVLEPLGARALVLQVGGRRIGIISAELAAIPGPLRTALREATKDLGLDELFVGATHTHSGPGGYWHSGVADWMGFGPYDPRIEAFLVGQLATALRTASGGLRPARIAVGEIEASNYAYNRNVINGPVDKSLTGVRITALDGTPLANLVTYAAHPTIIPVENTHLSGDWPGALMAALEAEGGPPTLFFQAAVGDVTWGKREGELTRADRAVRFGQSVARDAEGALMAGGQGQPMVALDLARVRIGLPPCDLGGAVAWPIERIASNVFCRAGGPGSTEVSFLRVGRLVLANVPGEVVASLGLNWRKSFGGAVVLSLMDDYLGYVESPAAIGSRTGEAARSYYGESLAPAVFEGLALARRTALGAGAEPASAAAALHP